MVSGRGTVLNRTRHSSVGFRHCTATESVREGELGLSKGGIWGFQEHGHCVHLCRILEILTVMMLF